MKFFSCIGWLLIGCVWFSAPVSAAGETVIETPSFKEQTGLIESPRAREIYEKLETIRESLLMKELALPAEKISVVVEYLRQAKQLRNTYLIQRYAIEHQLDTLLDYSEPNQNAIREALKKLDEMKLQYNEGMLHAEQTLREILNPEEQAKYLLFQRNFNKRLQEVLANIRQRQIESPSKPTEVLRKQATESVIRQSN